MGSTYNMAVAEDANGSDSEDAVGTLRYNFVILESLGVSDFVPDRVLRIIGDSGLQMKVRVSQEGANGIRPGTTGTINLSVSNVDNPGGDPNNTVLLP